jgi:hypothetical protein
MIGINGTLGTIFFNNLCDKIGLIFIGLIFYVPFVPNVPSLNILGTMGFSI